MPQTPGVKQHLWLLARHKYFIQPSVFLEERKKNPFPQVAGRNRILIIVEALKWFPTDTQNKNNCSGRRALIPQLIFRNMTKLIHRLIISLKMAAPATRGTELARGLLEFLKLPPTIRRRSPQMTRRVNLLDSYWCAVLNVLRRGCDPENPLGPFFFPFFVRSNHSSNWSAATAMWWFGAGGGDLTTNHPCDSHGSLSGSLQRPRRYKPLQAPDLKRPEVNCSVCFLAWSQLIFSVNMRVHCKYSFVCIFFFDTKTNAWQREEHLHNNLWQGCN